MTRKHMTVTGTPARARLLALLIALGLGYAVQAQGSGATHVLKDGSAVRCEVVAPESAGPVVQFAAGELAEILEQALGQKVAVVAEPTAGKTSIILGRSTFAQRGGIDVDALPRDGFVIHSLDEDILIVGRDDPATRPEREIKTSALLQRKQQFERGTLNGVYHFLETSLGVRFYFPGAGTVVPRHDELALPRLDWQVAPDHPRRDSGFSGVLPDGKDGAEAFPFKSMNRLRQRLQTQYIPNLHGLRDLDLIRRFGESHPEYFALLPDGRRHNNPTLTHAGHLCLSSGVREVIYQDAKAFLSGEPAETRGIQNRRGQYAWVTAAFQPGYFNLMPQDGFVPCACDACQKHYKGVRYRELDLASTSEFVWGLVCDVAERLKAEGVPGYVTMMAYAPYRDVPRRDIPDNVLVMVATTGPWNIRGFEEERDLIQRWNAKLPGRKVWLWNYISKHAEMSVPGVPCLTPKAVGSYYKRLSPDITGAYLGSASDRYLYQYLNTYIANRIFWDNDADVDALLAEHHRKMFGAAAPVMTQVYERIEANWIDRIANNQVQTALGPTSVPPSPSELWTGIYHEQEIATLDGWFDQAEAALGDDEPSLQRVRFMRAELMGPLKQQRETYMSRLRELAGLRTWVAPVDEGLAMQIDGVLDEPTWGASEVLTLQALPAKEPPPQGVTTTVRLLRDDQHLYVGFSAVEPAMDQLVSATRPADDRGIFKDSSVEVFLNPSGDLKNYFHVVINADGSITDQAGVKQGISQAYDWSWSSGARSAVRKHADGWVVELALPLDRLPPMDPKGFPANFARNRIIRSAPARQYSWSPYLQNGYHDLEHFGRIVPRPAAQANLIHNPDFSAPVVGRRFGEWYHHPQAGNDHVSWAIDTEQWVSGGQSLRLHSAQGADRVAIKQELPQLKPSTKYYLSYSIRTDNVVPRHPAGGAKVSLWDKKNNYFPATPYTGTIPWRKDGFTFTTSDQANVTTRSYLALILFEASGSVWFDNIQLVELADGD